MNVIISNDNDELLSSLNIEVIKKIKGRYSVDSIISMFENFYYEKMILDITAVNNYEDISVIQKLSISLDTDKLILLLDNSSKTGSAEYISALISMGIYNFTKNIDGVVYLLSHPNSYKDVASMHLVNSSGGTTVVKSSNVRTIGFKNLTSHAGASTLIYMIKKELEKVYRVAAVEIDTNDFMFYNDRNMISTTSDTFGEEIVKLSANFDFILVDLNKSKAERACSDIIYLLEPSIIKVNKLFTKYKTTLNETSGRKVVLVKSLLNDKDVKDFEMETGLQIYYRIPPLNDRVSNSEIKNFLIKLGFINEKVENTTEISSPVSGSSKLFNLFRHKS